MMTSDSQILFTVDDFDEATVGDYQYDVWRFVASLVLAVRLEKIVTSETEIVFARGYIQLWLYILHC